MTAWQLSILNLTFFNNVTVASFVAEMFHIVYFIYFIYYIDMDIKTIVQKVYFLLHNFIFV